MLRWIEVSVFSLCVSVRLSVRVGLDIELAIALSEGIPIIDPTFYADKVACPDESIAHVFRRAPQSEEDIPLLQERINIMRENGRILCEVSLGKYRPLSEPFTHPSRLHKLMLTFLFPR